MDSHRHFPEWGLRLFLFVLALNAQYGAALVTNVELPKEMQDCYDSYSHIRLRDVVGQSLSWSCEAPAIMRIRARDRPPITTPSSRAYISSLLSKVTDLCFDDFKRFTARKCIRKEYRVLNDEERHRFHRALNILKEDTTVDPNKYDAISRLHSGNVISTAHGGPNFPGWHRAYLLLMEVALQEVDPSICIPYWDSSLDSELDDPSLSYIFSPDFIGGGRDNRTVTDGPFAGWVTPDFGPLIRNIGATGQLYTTVAINNILSQRRTKDITPPTARPQNGLEYHHNAVHVFIGGQMNNLQSAASDPVFFLHHAFVDYLWEIFRTNQRAAGIDPELDYPQNFSSPLQAPYSLLGLHTLNLTAMQAYGNRLIETYEYQQSPTCNRYRPTCGSKYLKCNEQTGRCIPIDPSTGSPTPTCPRRKSPVGIQNTFCIDGVCDMRGWVYVPVKVVSMRSPDLQVYDSYPVYNGSVWENNDIYEPSAYPAVNRFITRDAPKSYHKCDDGNGIGQIFLQSSGLSYNGFYKESVIIDQRLATSIALGYVAVKNPRNGPVQSLFRAFDSCGRICHPGCKVPRTNIFHTCSGVFNIEDVPGRPKQYSETYGKATLSTWGYSNNKDCPSFLEDDIVLTFYCDYSDHMPWSRRQNQNGQNLNPTLATRNGQTQNRYECKIDDHCTVDVPCEAVFRQCSGVKHRCRETCNTYVVCSYGQLSKKTCPYNWAINSQEGRCDSRRFCPGSSAKTLSSRSSIRGFGSAPVANFNNPKTGQTVFSDLYV